MACSGPCLPHCSSPLVGALAYVTLACAFSTLGYLLLTRKAGTPLADSRTAEQRALKRASADVRGAAFATSLAAAVALLAVWRPIRF